jgi:hypothetical protein
MPEDQSPKQKTRFQRLLEFFNLTSISQTTPITTEYDNTKLGKYSQRELNKLSNRYISSLRDDHHHQRSDLLPITSLRPYLLDIYNKSGMDKNTAKRLVALAPELGRANKILTSSILSPNDLQKNKLLFECQIPGLEDSDTIFTDLNELLNEHFNNNLKLDEKLSTWLSEILFESGAKAVLCLPPQITDNMFDNITLNSSHESLQHTIDILMSKELFSSEDFTISTENQIIANSYTDNINITTNVLVSDIFDSIKETCLSTESLVSSDYLTSPEKLSPIINPIVESFSTENGLFKLSTNIDVLNYSYESKTLMRTKFNDALIKKFKGDERVDRFMRTTNKHIEEPIASILDYAFKNKDKHVSTYKNLHPILIELPTEAVIPVCIPGSSSEHLGYFILLDEYGYPLAIKNELTHSTYCKPGSVDSSYKMLFGDMCNNNIDKTIMEQIFDHVFSTVTNHKLKSLGIQNIKLIKYDDLTKVLFYRLLGKKKTNILFVPEILLMYFCFDYDENTGTGVALTENIKFALAVKTTLLMANMVAAMNAAVDHKRIEVNLDPKETNPEKILNDIREIYISNNLPIPSLNPWETANSVVRRSIQIIPKNIPGMTEFDVSTSAGEASNTTQVGTEIFEHINEMIKDGTGVPANALDKLPEEEYSRSIATNNILFARQLTEYQIVTIQHINKLILTYLSFNIPMQSKIFEIVSKSPHIKNTNKLNIHQLISNITLVLPSPQIAPDKSKFTEIKEYTDAIKELSDMIYPEELDIDSEGIKEARRVQKSLFRQKSTINFIKQLGFLEVMSLDQLDKFDFGLFFDEQLEMKNISMMLSEFKDKIDTIGGTDEDTSSEDSGGGDESGEEGGDDFGGDFGDLGDMGEEEGGKEGESEDMETSEETGDETNEPEEAPDTEESE